MVLRTSLRPSAVVFAFLIYFKSRVPGSGCAAESSGYSGIVERILNTHDMADGEGADTDVHRVVDITYQGDMCGGDRRISAYGASGYEDTQSKASAEQRILAYRRADNWEPG